MVKRRHNKLFGIIGCPVEHSLSPYMHNAAFKSLKINAVYLPFSVKRNKLKEAILSLRKSGISGFNVTIPFKSECIKYLDKIEPTARMIGAVNTVCVKGNKFIGYNTDYLGFIRSLKEDLNFKPKGRSVLVLGSGGAARAVSFGLAREGAGRIYLYDIVEKKARSLSLNIKRFFPKCSVMFCAKKDLNASMGSCQLLVNCTPLGMRRTDPMPINIRLMYDRLKIYDIIYTPLRTKLLKSAKEKGIKAVGGVGMLLYQGAIAFKLWTKKEPPIALMKKTLLDNLKC
ncbi:MAG: shikimate dehydrogenase [Candidatus Omnitrophota bacterium]